jgi:galactofuranose transport system permease protein
VKLPRQTTVTSMTEGLAVRWLGGLDALDWLAERGVYLGLFILVAFNVAFTRHFVEVDTIRLQFVQVVPVAIVALGMALVIGTKGIDLSVGSVMAISSALLALYLGYGPIAAIAVALIGAAAVGLVNGVLVAVVGVQPIVATLALLVGGRGLALVLAEGRLTEIFDPTLAAIGSQRVLGVPIVVLIAITVSILVAVAVRRTTFGRYLVAIGGNRIELSAITAVVVGGTPLAGGRVRIVGTLAGAMLMQLIAATLISHNLPDSATRMIQAVIILGAVFVQRQRGGV